MVTPQPTRIRILHFFKNYTALHGVQPTVREIGTAIGLKSTSTVYGHLLRLQRDGLLTISPLKPQSVARTTSAAKPKKVIRKFEVVNEDGITGYLAFPVFEGMSEVFTISHYTDSNGSHIVVKCTECT